MLTFIKSCGKRWIQIFLQLRCFFFLSIVFKYFTFTSAETYLPQEKLPGFKQGNLWILFEGGLMVAVKCKTTLQNVKRHQNVGNDNSVLCPVVAMWVCLC